MYVFAVVKSISRFELAGGVCLLLHICDENLYVNLVSNSFYIVFDSLNFVCLQAGQRQLIFRHAFEECLQAILEMETMVTHTF